MYVISVTYKGDLFRKLFDLDTLEIYDEISSHYTRDIFAEGEPRVHFEGTVNCIRDCSKQEILLDAIRLAVEFGATSDQVTKLLTFCQVDIGERHISFYESNSYYSVNCWIELKFRNPTEVTIGTLEFNTTTRCTASDFYTRFDGLFRKIDIIDTFINIISSYSKTDSNNECFDEIKKYVEEFNTREPAHLVIDNIEDGNIECINIGILLSK